MIHTTSGGVIAAPNRDPACVIPCAYPRSAGSIHRESDRVAFGNAPASPAPNRNRNVDMEAKFQESAVAEVKILHQVTIQASARRGPKRSPSHPPGNWNSAYPQRNA